jgi:hypothetical protein
LGSILIVRREAPALGSFFRPQIIGFFGRIAVLTIIYIFINSSYENSMIYNVLTTCLIFVTSIIDFVAFHGKSFHGA